MPRVTPPAVPLTQPRRQRAVLAIVLVSYLMIVLDISIVITALPKISLSLHMTPVALTWVQSAYTLTFGGLLLLGARAGDLLGRRRMLMAGLALFTAASLAIGIAPSAGWLIAARAVQGVGAAVLAPATLALLSTHFAEGPERTRAVGYYGAVAGIGASVGLVLGGLLAGWLSWRVGFFVNLPVGVALIVAVRRYVDESPRRPGRFDLAGAALATLGATGLVYGMVRAASAGWQDPRTVAALSAGLALCIALVLHERRAAQPIMPLRLFASRERCAAYAARLLYLGGMMGFWFFTTQYLQGVLGFSPFAAGLAFLPATVANFAAALAVPALARRIGNARLLAAGMLLAALGMAALAQVSPHTPYLLGVALPMVVIGVGQGATLSPLTLYGIAGVAAQDAGAASGLVNVFHQLGSSLGLGVLAVVFAAAAGGGDVQAALTHRIASAFAASALLLAAAWAVAMVLIVLPGLRRLQPQPA